VAEQRVGVREYPAVEEEVAAAAERVAGVKR